MSFDPPRPDSGPLVAELFRRRAGLMTARLARLFGSGGLSEAEEAVQEALLDALRTWPFRGVPDNPEAWLWRAARNRALDRLRRRSRETPIDPQMIEALMPVAVAVDDAGQEWFARELRDDRMGLVFACCHPSLPVEQQVALTLKTVCGLGVGEIAAAFLVPQATLAQRLVRAKAALADRGVAFALPTPDELAPRLIAVRQVLYLLFTAGYEAMGGDRLVRIDIAGDAVELARDLARHPATGDGESQALAALLCLHAARLPARSDPLGVALPLSMQAAGKLDTTLASLGMAHLRQSMGGNTETRLHLEAAIAAAHVAAMAAGQPVDWPGVVGLYDRLAKLAPDDPIIALNRVIARLEALGPAHIQDDLAALAQDRRLSAYAPYHALRAEVLARGGNSAAAREALAVALALPLADPVRARLAARMAMLE